MTPSNALLLSNFENETTARVLAEPGKVYAVYIKGHSTLPLALELPGGSYSAEWVHPKSGESEAIKTVRHEGGRLELGLPAYEEDLALRLTRR